MKIRNPLKINDWEINKFLRVIFAIQVLVLVIVVMDWLGLHIPVLTEIVPLIYLLFVPGILVLRIMKIHEIGSGEVLLYSIGLSVTSIMSIGFFTNLIYPLLGISNPISLLPLIITLTIFVIALSFLSYWRDHEFSNPDFINLKGLPSSYMLFLFLIPLLAILGTYLMNTYKINILIMVLLAMISLTVVLFAFRKIPSKLYPLTIFIISISLLFQTSLISSYITGWDIQAEYYFANFVMENAFWNLTLSNVLNTTLSITLLAPIISIVSNMNLDSVFKIVYPLLFSLVPLGLYIVLKNQTSTRVAFLSSFFFVSFFVFFTEMLALGRQEIAEFFLVLLLMVMVSSKINNTARSIFFLIFGISLILSHYALSYIYMFSLLIVYLMVMVNNRHDLMNSVNSFLRNNKEQSVRNKDSKKYKILSFSFISFFIIFAISWYMYVSSSVSLMVFLNLGNNIASSITTEFLNPTSVQSLSIIQAPSSPIHSLFRYITYLTQFFIMIGVLSILFKDKMKFKNEYVAFILVNVLILIGAVTVPHFSSALNTERLYQITLIFLAPTCVIGGIIFISLINRIVRKLGIRIKNIENKSIPILSVFFVIFLLFNSGLVYYLANDASTSIALNSTIDTASYNGMEVQGVDWLSINGIGVTQYGKNSHSGVVIDDDYRQPLLLKYGLSGYPFSYYYESNFTTMEHKIKGSNINKTDFYFFFGTKNVLTNTFVTYNMTSYLVGASSYRSASNFNISKIYDSNGAQILYEPL